MDGAARADIASQDAGSGSLDRGLDGSVSADLSFPAGPLEIARGQGLPTGIAVNASALFWANEEDGTIATCPVEGCPGGMKTVLAANQTRAKGVALSTTSVYWVVENPGPSFAVRRCPLAGCGATGPTTLLTDSGIAYGVAVDLDNLYVAAGTRLLRCSRDGCPATSATVLVSGSRVSGVAVNATHFYYVRMSRVAAYAGIFRCPLAGCGSRSADEDDLNATGPGLTSVAVDDRNVYWTDDMNYWGVTQAFWSNRINRCPLVGCQPYAPTTVTSGEITPWGIAVDSAYFYWTEHQKGRITRTQKPR